MWLSTGHRRVGFLSENERSFFAEILCNASVTFVKPLERVNCPLLPNLGPYHVGDRAQLPVTICKILLEYQYIKLVPYEWLSIEELKKWIMFENKTESLKEVPDLYFYELANIFFDK